MLSRCHSNAVPFAIIAAIGTWSAINPYDKLTWFLEALPILLLFLAAILTSRRFTFTPLAYWLFALGCALVLIGAHYTYSRMPAFEALKDLLSLERNHYDRFGHFFQGFVPAIIFREVALRTSRLQRGLWLWIIVIALCTTKSVIYEFAEWWTTIILGESAHEFLAMQGDEWDAQKDMFWAFTGSIAALWTLSRLHDRQLARLAKQSASPAASAGRRG